MLYDVAHFPIALLVALALGVAVGFLTRSREPRRGPVLVVGRGWIFWAAVVVPVAVALALTHALPGRPGLWLETALLLFAAYLAGCPLPGLVGGGSVAPGGRATSSARAKAGAAMPDAAVSTTAKPGAPAGGIISDDPQAVDRPRG